MKRKNYIALILSLVTAGACLFTACKETEEDSTIKEPALICDMLTQNTDYTVVIPSDYTKTEEYSAKQICSYFEEITGENMDFVVDSQMALTTDSTYISLGDTSLFESAEKEHGDVDLSEATLNADGFYIFTYGKSVFINAYNDRGIMYGAFEFIENTLGVKFLTNDYTYVPKSNSIILKEYDKSYAPLFKQRTYLNTAVDRDDVEYTAHMRYNTDYCEMPDYMGGSTQWANLGPSHTSFNIVDPNDYVTGETIPGTPGSVVIKDEYKHVFAHTGTDENPDTMYINVGGRYEVLDLCYSSGVNEDGTISSQPISTVKLAIEGLKEKILADEEAEYFMFGQQDRTYGCACNRCKADNNNYKASGLMIRFINCVSDGINEWLKQENINRDINFVIFAYSYNEFAPIDSDGNPLSPTVIPRENVYIRYAPIHGIQYYSLNDERQDAETRGVYSDWGKLTDNLMVWTYHAYYAEYFWYLPTIQAMKDTLLLLKEVGTEYEFAQGCYEDNGIYEQWIESYVFSKLCWDIEADVEDLRNEFVYYYFGEDAYEYVVEFHNRVEDRYSLMSMDTNITMDDGRDIFTAAYWQYSFMNGLCDLFDQAIAKTEANTSLGVAQRQTLVQHLEKAKLTPMYMRLYNANSYVELTKEDVISMAQEWIDLAEKYGVTRYGEGSNRLLNVIKEKYNLN